MNLIQRVMDDTGIVGVVIDDGFQYPIQLLGLHARDTFEALIASGWEYKSYPFGFVKDGLSLDKLPSIAYSTLSAEERADFKVFGSEVLTEAQLRTRLPEENKYLQLNPTAIQAHDRASFLKLLDDTQNMGVLLGVPETYLPINMIVAADALFDIMDYYKPENTRYRTIIERREKISYDVYQALVRTFMDMDLLDPTFTALDFKRAYYGWGVPGIKSRIVSMEIIEDPFVVARKPEQKLRIDYHTIDRSGLISPPLVKRQTTVLSSDELDAIISPLEPGEFKVISTSIPINNTVVEMNLAACGPNSSSFKCRFDESQRELSISRINYLTYDEILPVRATNGKQLDVEYYNTTIPAIRNKQAFAIVVAACVDRVMRNTVKVVDTNSIDLVQRIFSLTPAGAVRYILGHQLGNIGINPDVIDLRARKSRNELEKDEASTDMIEMSDTIKQALSLVEEYFRGEMDVTPDNAEAIAIIEDVLSGQTNIDDIARGAAWDLVGPEHETRTVFNYALNHMGETPENLIEKCLQFTGGKISFTNAQGTLNVNIPLRNEKEGAISTDVTLYRGKCFDDAMLWCYVLEAYTEPYGPPFNHCAVRMLTLAHRRSRGAAHPAHEAMKTMAGEIFVEFIETLSNPIQRKGMYTLLPSLVANLIFGIKVHNITEVDIPKVLGGGRVAIPTELIAAVNNCREFVEMTESTYGCSDKSCKRDEVYYAYVNAQITPHKVIPVQGASITERPFIPMWRNLQLPVYASVVQNYRHILPTPSFTGHSSSYGIDSLLHPPSEGEQLLLDSPYSLVRYHMELGKDKKKADELKTRQFLPMSLAERHAPLAFEPREGQACTPEEYRVKLQMSEPRALTKEVATAEMTPVSLPAPKTNIILHPVTNLDITDIQCIPFDLLLTFMDELETKICALRLSGNYVKFLDGYTHNFADGLPDSKYAYAQYSDRVYILTVGGKLIKGDMNEIGKTNV